MTKEIDTKWHDLMRDFHKYMIQQIHASLGSSEFPPRGPWDYGDTFLLLNKLSDMMRDRCLPLDWKYNE